MSNQPTTSVVADAWPSNSKRPNFAQSPQHQSLLDISRRHREAIDSSRVYDGKVIGQDNWDNLAVSTVFAAVAIEAALNDYILSHCLFVEAPYLQEVFGNVTERFVRGPIYHKMDLLKKYWPDQFQNDLLKDVKTLIDIRNLVTHQTGKFYTANETSDGRSKMAGHAMTAENMLHMLRHYEIARDFLSRFWFPGDRELQQGRSESQPA